MWQNCENNYDTKLTTNKRRREPNSPSTMEIIGNTTSHVNFLKIKIFLSTSGSTCKPGWSQDHLDLQKMAYIHLAKKKKKKKNLYVKLTYCDHPNKNVEHPNLIITKSWVQQK